MFCYKVVRLKMPLHGLGLRGTFSLTLLVIIFFTCTGQTIIIQNDMNNCTQNCKRNLKLNLLYNESSMLCMRQSIKCYEKEKGRRWNISLDILTHTLSRYCLSECFFSVLVRKVQVFFYSKNYFEDYLT